MPDPGERLNAQSSRLEINAENGRSTINRERTKQRRFRRYRTTDNEDVSYHEPESRGSFDQRMRQTGGRALRDPGLPSQPAAAAEGGYEYQGQRRQRRSGAPHRHDPRAGLATAFFRGEQPA